MYFSHLTHHHCWGMVRKSLWTFPPNSGTMIPQEQSPQKDCIGHYCMFFWAGESMGFQCTGGIFRDVHLPRYSCRTVQDLLEHRLPKAFAVVQSWQSIGNSWIGFGEIDSRRASAALFRQNSGDSRSFNLFQKRCGWIRDCCCWPWWPRLELETKTRKDE